MVHREEHEEKQKTMIGHRPTQTNYRRLFERIARKKGRHPFENNRRSEARGQAVRRKAVCFLSEGLTVFVRDRRPDKSLCSSAIVHVGLCGSVAKYFLSLCNFYCSCFYVRGECEMNF